MATGCKVLAFVNWSCLQAFVGHVWVVISLQSLGTCELKQCASSGLSIANWQQFARFWHWQTGNNLQGIGTCELAKVCKVFALANWQQYARNWHLWIGNSLEGSGTCELATVCKVFAFVNWQQFARYWLLWIGNSWQGPGNCELATVCKVLALVVWHQLASSRHLWIKVVCKLWFIIAMGKVWFGTCLWATVYKVLALVNWSCLLAFVWLLWIGNSLQGFGTDWRTGNNLKGIGTDELKLSAGTCGLTSACKFLAFVNWSILQALVYHWHGQGLVWHTFNFNSLQSLGTCGLKLFASFCLAFVGWHQPTSSWHLWIKAICKLWFWQWQTLVCHLWIGNSLQGLDSCELKVFASFCLAFVHLGAYQWGKAQSAWQDFPLTAGQSAKCLAWFYPWKFTSGVKRQVLGRILHLWADQRGKALSDLQDFTLGSLPVG